MFEDPVDRLTDEQVSALVDSWIPADRAELSEHTRLEVAYAVDAEHEPGDTPPLAEDAPVPACTCAKCLALGRGMDIEEASLVEVIVGDLAQIAPSNRLDAATAAQEVGEDSELQVPSAGWLCRRAAELPWAVEPEPDPADREQDELPVEEARRVSILELARRLGCGKPEPRGGEYVVRCPLHDDHDPSLRLNPEKGPPGGVWKCWPCGEGGDGIELVQAVQGFGFPESVRWIAGERRAA